jgi:hypothetical protein
MRSINFCLAAHDWRAAHTIGRVTTRLSEHRAALVVLLMIPATFVVLVVFGAGTAGAASWTPAVVAAAAAIAIPRYLRVPVPLFRPPGNPHGTLVFVHQRALIVRAGLLALGIVLIESIVSSVAGGRSAHALSTMLGLPIGMFIVYLLGRWSAPRLPVTRPWLWLAGIAAASRVLRLLLYGATVNSLPLDVLARNVALGVLVFFFLVLGNLHARRLSVAPVHGAPPMGAPTWRRRP